MFANICLLNDFLCLFKHGEYYFSRYPVVSFLSLGADIVPRLFLGHDWV